MVDPPVAPTSPTPRRRRKSSGSTLWRYLVVRFTLIFPTVFILVTMVFVLMRLTGDPITVALGGKLPPDQLQERIHSAGYDRPIIVQYLEFLGQIFTFNFGNSLTDNQPIVGLLVTHGTATLELAFYASSSRSSSASRSAKSPPTSAIAGRMRSCASSRSSPTRPPCSSPACCSSSSSPSGSRCSRSQAARRRGPRSTSRRWTTPPAST